MSAKENLLQKEEVKGSSTNTAISITPTPSLTISRTPTTPETHRIKITTTPIAKQFGGWYWNSQLGISQRWMGTDSQGKNIWSDTVDVSGKVGPLYSNNNSFGGSISEKSNKVIVGTTNGEVDSSQLASEDEPFEASWSEDNSNGSAKITANKQLKECEGKETSPVSTGGGYEAKTALKHLRGNICQLFFSPPNTPNYDWPNGARVVSSDNEEKTFGNW